MARSGVLLEAATSYYGNLVTNALTVMRSTQEDLRTGQFGISKTVGNVVSYWLDAYEGWWSALLVTASAPLPTAFLRLGPQDTTNWATVNVLVPGGDDPEFTDLGLIGGEDTISKSHLSVETNKDANGVQVRLKGLDPKSRAALTSGLYQGLVHTGVKPLAIILVRVDDVSVTAKSIRAAVKLAGLKGVAGKTVKARRRKPPGKKKP
jgi:hypothetical protein